MKSQKNIKNNKKKLNDTIFKIISFMIVKLNNF